MSQENGPFYVIVGLGFSAVLNHLLLRTTDAGRKRVGSLPILHIGLPDPWAGYAVSRMGQWPCLLVLPEFADRYETLNSVDFLSCESFARATEQELRDILARFPKGEVRAGIVEAVSRVSGDFKVTFVDATGRRCHAIAQKIDFCAGLGPARKLKTTQVTGASLREEYFDETIAPNPRRIMTAVDFLKKRTKIAKGAAICIYGDGGTAAWCVERALRSNLTKEVLWVSRTRFSADTFPPSERNDHLVASFTRDAKTLSPPYRITPVDPRLRLGLGYEIAHLNLKTSGLIEISFQPYPLSPTRTSADYRSADLTPLSLQSFNQVVVSIGQTDGEGRGCLDQLTKNVMRKKYDISSHTGLLTGFADDASPEHSRIRILGPAITRIAKRYPSASGNALAAYRETLCRQADGAEIPPGALSIARVNGFLGGTRANTNINTADLADLKQLSIDETIARKLISGRRQRVEPFIQLPPEPQLASLELYYGYRAPED